MNYIINTYTKINFLYNLYKMKTKKLFPIRELEVRTGVKPSTIRAWERRYGLIQPNRTPKGHRLYSDQDVEKIARIKELLSDGHSFVGIKKIIDSNANNALIHTEYNDIWKQTIAQVQLAISDFSYNRVDSIYNNITALYPIDMVAEKLLEPLLSIYEKQHQPAAESGFFNQWLQMRLTSRFHYDNGRSKDAKRVILLSSNNKETSLMLIGNMIVSQGYQALFFGNLLPLDQIIQVIEKSAAKAVLIMPNKEQMHLLKKSKILEQINVPAFIFGNLKKNVIAQTEFSDAVFLGDNKAIAVNTFRSQMLNRYHD